MASMKAWITENIEFLNDVVPMLSQHAKTRAVLNLLYRYRAVPPQHVLNLVDDLCVYPPNTYAPAPALPGWVYLRTPKRPATPPPVSERVVHAPKDGIAWNRIVASSVPSEDVAPKDAPEDDEEEFDEVEDAIRRFKDAIRREEAFDTETFNNDLLLELLEDVRMVASRHNCCNGVHSASFGWALGDLVGA